MASSAAAPRRATRPARSTRSRPRARQQRGRSGIRWDRVGRLALLGTLGIILALYVSPVHTWITQRGTAAEHRAEQRDLEQKNAELRERIKYLREPDAVEREARKLGMVRKGERAFVIQNPPKKP
jgi:cell division protein FtsB